MPSPSPQTYRFEFHAPDDVIFGFSAFVLPEYRGRRLFTAIHRFAARHYIDAGYRTVVSIAGVWNRASREAHSHAGEQPYIEIMSWIFLGFAIVRYRGRTHFRYLTKGRRFPVYIY
jgi:hypothetical protein